MESEQGKKRVQVRVAQNKKGTEEAGVMRNQSSDGVFSDVLGSYTGTPADGGMPEQDSDDI